MLAFEKYVPRLSNRLEPSDIRVEINQTNSPKIIPITINITIIALVFRFNLHFFIRNLIPGSSNKDITKANKKGI